MRIASEEIRAKLSDQRLRPTGSMLCFDSSHRGNHAGHSFSTTFPQLRKFLTGF